MYRFVKKAQKIYKRMNIHRVENIKGDAKETESAPFLNISAYVFVFSPGAPFSLNTRMISVSLFSLKIFIRVVRLHRLLSLQLHFLR